MKFLSLPSIAKCTSDLQLARELQQAQKRDFNGLSQRQCRGLKDLEDSKAPAAEIADFKSRINVEKERVRIRNFLMLKHGLTLAIYNDPGRLAIFKTELDGKYDRRDLGLLRQVREGQGLEFLDYANDSQWIIAEEDEEDDATVRQQVKDAMQHFDTAMDNVVGADWDKLMGSEPALMDFTVFGDEEDDDEEEDDEDDDDKESDSSSSDSES